MTSTAERTTALGLGMIASYVGRLEANSTQQTPHGVHPGTRLSGHPCSLIDFHVTSDGLL